jgi:hypothetical protein
MLSEEKDILVCKEFTIKLGCRNYQFYYYVVENGHPAVYLNVIR